MPKLLPGASIVDRAYPIFSAEGRPMHYLEVYERLKQVMTFRGRTPEYSVNSALGTDGRFVRLGKGMFALREWGRREKARRR